MYTHHWLTWAVTEYRRQEEIDWARCQALAEMVEPGIDRRDALSWWRTAVTRVTAAGRRGFTWSKPMELAHGR